MYYISQYHDEKLQKFYKAYTDSIWQQLHHNFKKYVIIDVSSINFWFSYNKELIEYMRSLDGEVVSANWYISGTESVSVYFDSFKAILVNDLIWWTSQVVLEKMIK